MHLIFGQNIEVAHSLERLITTQPAIFVGNLEGLANAHSYVNQTKSRLMVALSIYRSLRLLSPQQAGGQQQAAKKTAILEVSIPGAPLQEVAPNFLKKT